MAARRGSICLHYLGAPDKWALSKKEAEARELWHSMRVQEWPRSEDGVLMTRHGYADLHLPRLGGHRSSREPRENAPPDDNDIRAGTSLLNRPFALKRMTEEKE